MNPSERAGLLISREWPDRRAVGGRQLIEGNIDVIAMKSTLVRTHPATRAFSEIIILMTEFGFRYFNDVGGWREPGTGLVEGKDVLS